MRWVHMSVIAVVAAATVIFAFQNLQSVTVAFLGFRLSAPLAVLIAVSLRARHGDRRQPWSMFRWALDGIETSGDAISRRSAI